MPSTSDMEIAHVLFNRLQTAHRRLFAAGDGGEDALRSAIMNSGDGDREVNNMATTIHTQFVGDTALVPRNELEDLLELARRSADLRLEVQGDDIPTAALMRLAEQGGAFDWLADEPDLYSVDDSKVRYR